MEWKYPELKTPITKSDYTTLIEKELKIASHLLSSEWKYLKKNTHGDILSQISYDDTQYVKTSGTLSKVFLTNLIEVAFHLPLNEKKKIESDILDYRFLDDIDENTYVCTSKFKAPLRMAPRDFVYIKALREVTEDSYLIIFKSINREDYPFKEGVVRGTLTTYYYIQDLGNLNVTLTIITNIDPKGWIPNWISIIVKNKELARFEKIREYLT